jgi:hypothetical protein
MIKCEVLSEVRPLHPHDPNSMCTAFTNCRTHGVSVEGFLPIKDGLCLIGRIERLEKAMVDSTSDERTVNNVMRHEYRVLTDTEKSEMKAIKDTGLEFHDLLTSIGTSREMSRAKTKLEEAVMWAVKHITR